MTESQVCIAAYQLIPTLPVQCALRHCVLILHDFAIIPCTAQPHSFQKGIERSAPASKSACRESWNEVLDGFFNRRSTGSRLTASPSATTASMVRLSLARCSFSCCSRALSRSLVTICTQSARHSFESPHCSNLLGNKVHCQKCEFSFLIDSFQVQPSCLASSDESTER